MSDLPLYLEAFHFLRPLWLLLIPLVLLMWWWVRRPARRSAMSTEGIAPHLREALTVGRAQRRRLTPIDSTAAILILGALGAAGPSWSRQPDPFAAQSAPAVIVLAVTPGMEATDLPPSRLERGKQKIRDFLELRAGARTALVAYAGSAHVVLPMTEDAQVMVPYLEGLSPEIMPREGTVAGEALALAEAMLAEEGAPGGILFVTDALDPADVAALDASAAPLAVLSTRPEGSRDRGLDALSAPVIAVTPDPSDIRRLDGLLNAAYRRAQLDDVDQPWEDRAHWLAWPAAVILLLWFRRGWTMRWVVIAALGLMAVPQGARAEGVADWFLTPDQQGRIAYDRRQYARAAELFVDPLRRGHALYRSGQYEAAVEVLDRVETAQAAFIQGLAEIKGHNYRDGVRAFEAALARDPDYPGAAENLATATRIVAYVEAAQEASDTGEDQGIGADEEVYDNESGQGEETEREAGSEGGGGLLTADQWMNTVDTRTEDFLRLRFALEAAQPPQSANTAAPAGSTPAAPEEPAEEGGK
ncbi:vWA domain-containing protein [Salipiger mangrovisoli]|uniref:VWA domain-containing protein n=1 Tax=Salipiger mangrovisoli TaxID=2865933 RepID=A0ABR9WW19_9RHOB|nr:VWA domain-containing protein [Salipiger mangrovisoli]MBE9635481.1 VWA domain-containing protein [Salipiger mangrovisoli]